MNAVSVASTKKTLTYLKLQSNLARLTLKAVRKSVLEADSLAELMRFLSRVSGRPNTTCRRHPVFRLPSSGPFFRVQI